MEVPLFNPRTVMSNAWLAIPFSFPFTEPIMSNCCKEKKRKSREKNQGIFNNSARSVETKMISAFL
jgi:hypothetical protein